MPDTDNDSNAPVAPHSSFASAPRHGVHLTMMPQLDEPTFWRSVWGLQGSITLRIMPHVLVFGLFSLAWLQVHLNWPELALEVGPVEVAGGALGLLLVLRTNAGYDRWWEGRKMWGGITNHVRGLVTGGLAYGPKDPAWRRHWVGLCASFAHVARLSLRDDRNVGVLVHLLGTQTALDVQRAHHMPSDIAQRMAAMLEEARLQQDGIHFGFVGLERSRQALLDCIGSCERIASTPLPRVYVLKIRRFIAMYLFAVPLALVDKVGLATPLLVMLVAYPVLGMDRIAQELQSPFLPKKMSHLPLDLICQTLENNALALLASADQHQAAPTAAQMASTP